MKKQINYGEEVLRFIKSLPQVRAPYGGKRWEYGSLLDIRLSSDFVGVYDITFDMFGEQWTEVSNDNTSYDLTCYTYGVNNTDLVGNLKEIYTIIEANKKDIIKAFTVDNSDKIADLKEQIERLNN